MDPDPLESGQYSGGCEFSLMPSSRAAVTEAIARSDGRDQVEFIGTAADISPRNDVRTYRGNVDVVDDAVST